MATPKLSSFHLESVVVEQDALEVIASEFMAHTGKDMEASAAADFEAKCVQLIEKGQLQQLVEAFIDSLKKVGAKASPGDFQARFAILFSLARHLPQPVLNDVVPKATDVVTTVPALANMEAIEDVRLRVTVLRNLYTVIDPRSPTRYGLLLAMVTLALKNHTYEILDGTTASDINELCAMWNTDKKTEVEQARELYRQFSALSEDKIATAGATLNADDLRAEELKQYRFLLGLIETYETDAEKVADAVPFAARAAKFAVKYPLPGDMAISSQLEALSLDGVKRSAAAVQAAEQSSKVDWANLTATASSLASFKAAKALATSPQYASIAALLEIFACQGLEEFLKFRTANTSAMADLGLDGATCLTNIRYLTLASLAANSETVSYKTIAEKLHVDLADVEKWVIDGCTCKVIDAKMDQQTESIVINRGSQRLLNEQQWTEVQAKLAQWKTSVRGLLGTIKAVRQEHHLLQQQQ
mmetsp:Transcript_4804/g.8545  ORF Transcript_4804/g.8545 Transcript_4804/m.8545 type:complete len:473 (-) Transcript_4804:428-1846(-)|eukprot:CAMPEP_0184517292 /NCGR_PEP_ID=MMETSP0198_2-20121128/5482_1 /TAXON_ID=1112570 /ORGANISM="Thraustochytrium sp., Strain LLF1b" /LENGTH=472 /DNA_ID=CAMNT_0026907665 /DNA_START=177 /DNA_END=1595 /DNA_ORIENTATION=+